MHNEPWLIRRMQMLGTTDTRKSEPDAFIKSQLCEREGLTLSSPFNTLLSMRRVKIELDFKEMKTYKVTGRFGGTRAGSCLFAWSYTFI